MPPRNKKTTKDTRNFPEVTPEQITVGTQPKPTPPAGVAVKNLQDALIEGYASVSAFSRNFLDINPYPKQAEVLDAFRDVSIGNFSAGNRVGKTFNLGIWLLWKGFYRHHPSRSDAMNRTAYNVYKAVNTSLTFEQAKLGWTYAYNFASASKRFKPFLVDTVHSPFPLMKLRTRDEKGAWQPSEIHARSLAKNGLYLLGMSINHLQVDECAYVPKYETIEDEVLKMRLADTGGSIFRVSTPNGRNFFFLLYQKGTGGNPLIVSRTLTSWDNPFVDRDYLKEQEEQMLHEFYLQNVMGEFVSLSDFFPLNVIEGLYTNHTKDGPEPIEYGLPVPPVRGGVYVMGADLGQSKDPTEVIVWRVDVDPVQTVFIDTRKGGGWEGGKQFVKIAHMLYKPVWTAVDATGGGGHIAEQLMAELDGIIPFVFSYTSKPLILTALQYAAQRRRFVFPFGQQTQGLVHQMSFYRTDDKELTQDKVMALALVNHAYERWADTNKMHTEIFEDLAFVDVRRGGQEIYGTDAYGPGTLFNVNPTNGMYLPLGYGEGGMEDDEWVF